MKYNDKGEYVKSHLEALNIYENNNGRLEGGRQEDPTYNDENAKYQIYTFGCSWTYGWCLEQEQSFPHLCRFLYEAFVLEEHLKICAMFI